LAEVAERATLSPVTRTLPTGTVTLLFTDIEGSTRLLRELGRERYGEVLAQHRHLLRGTFEAYNGVEFGTEGDSFFVVFASAGDAVAAASAAQRALVDIEVRVRIGIHTGEPMLVSREDGYVGIDVHRAARIMSAGHGGQVLLSRTTRDLINDDVELRDLGEHRLKDLSEPLWIYQLGGGEFTPLKSLSNSNLPTPATPLIGRAREVAELVAQLRREDVRLLTLTGPGGTGKTRLAVELGYELVEEFPNGVFFVGLAPLVEPGLLASTIAQTLGAKERGTEPPLELLCEHLADKWLLLVLDNCEHLLEAVPLLGELLEATPKLTVLATSRERLHLSGEYEFPVTPLAEKEALELFAARAIAARSSFVLDGNREQVAEICRRLDALPLAIELAAARMRVLSPAALLARLEQRLPLLTGGTRDVPERQRTLRATIAWSYELLEPEEQRLFAHLAVFAGGCTLEAAEEVCGADIDTLAALVDKSLIRQSGDRFWMLATLREYALEQLAGAKEDAEQRMWRHVDYYVELSELARPELMKPDQAAWLDRLEAEHGNFRSALQFMLDRGERERALKLATGLAPFWQTRGHLAEAKRWFESALDSENNVDSVVLGRALNAAGNIADLQGDYVRAGDLLDSASAIFTEIGDTKGLAWALNNRGIVAANCQELEQARALHEQSLLLATEVDDTWLVASASINLGNIAFFEQDYARAAELEDKGLRICLALGDRHRAALACLNLGWTHLLADDAARATTRLLESLQAFGELGERRRLPDVFEGLGGAASLEHRSERAAMLFAAACRIREELGSPVSEYEAKLHATYLNSARDEIGPESFDSAWSEGRAMSAEQAIEFAHGLGRREVSSPR
jgi:predicted ATPase/class 3 adenylate cyclase